MPEPFTTIPKTIVILKEGLRFSKTVSNGAKGALVKAYVYVMT